MVVFSPDVGLPQRRMSATAAVVGTSASMSTSASYGRLDGLHAAMGALMVEADRADVEDAAGRPE